MKGLGMKHFGTSIEINAAPEKIWAILTDAAAYPAWDPNMLKLEGTIAANQRLTIYTKLAPNRAFKPIVSAFDAPKWMVWESGMPLGLFKGVRTFKLEALGENHTRFTTQETFSGLLMPLFGKTIPDLDPVFAEFGKAIKARAEA